jgi:hypothetical protein
MSKVVKYIVFFNLKKIEKLLYKRYKTNQNKFIKINCNKMVETVIVFVILTPMGLLIGLYQFFNQGRMPCINLDNIDNLNRATVAVEG